MYSRFLSPLLILLTAVGVVSAWAAVRAPGPADDSGVAPGAGGPNGPFLNRLAGKHEVTSALLRGEVTLAEAAARFRELNGDEAIGRLRDLYPDAADGELPYRQVVQFVASDPRAAPVDRSDRLRALHREFFAHFPSAAPFPERFSP